MYALVDCNNFYVSCERIFNPGLEKRPVIVLSNNDGCIISRSNEAKKLGLPMGGPFFKYSDFCKKNNVAVFSSNYELYGDISQRIMSSLKYFCPNLEIYSIDEAFLDLGDISEDLVEFCNRIACEIKMWIGVPVSIGIAPTKTLAKIANRMAKQSQTLTYDLRDIAYRNLILEKTPLIDIWGIGHQLIKKLPKLGITNAKQLSESAPGEIRQWFGVTVERTLWELRGVSCIKISSDKTKKNIMSSRSFGQAITHLQELEEAVSCYVATACTKLRKQGSKAQGIYVFVQTDPFNSKEKCYKNGIFYRFVEPSADSCFITQIAKINLKKIFIPNLNYKKAGIMLIDLIADTYYQNDFFIDSQVNKPERLMKTLDDINRRIGRGSIFLAAESTNGRWKRKEAYKSKNFTTRWSDLLTIATQDCLDK